MRGKLPVLAAALMVGLVLAAFLPAVALTNPTVYSSTGFAAQGASVLPLSLSVRAGDGLVVFEWIGVVLSGNPCTSIFAPSDSNLNTWAAIGLCVVDGNGGAMLVYQVASATATGMDTVNCNFQGPNSYVESCYAFDVSGGGAITGLASGAGNSNRPQTAAVPAASNSLLLQVVGIQFYCQSVVGGSTFQQFIPSSVCNSGGGSFSNYGLAGGYVEIPTGGLVTGSQLILGQVAIWSEAVVQVAPAGSSTTTTSSTSTTTTSIVYTATVTGWLTPDSAHFANTLVLVILPLAGFVFGLLPLMMFQKPKEIGDKAIYPSLFGMLAGSLVADLTVNGLTELQVPFAFIVVEALLLFLWWWNS